MPNSPSEGDRRRLVRIGGAVAARFGIRALLGWVVGLRRMASFGPDLYAMAPSKALMFAQYGSAALLRTRQSLGRGSHRVGVTINSAGAPIYPPLKSFRHVLPIIRHHHEKMDGSGCWDGTLVDASEVVLNDLRRIHSAAGKR
jgi:hypothetical protein